MFIIRIAFLQVLGEGGCNHIYLVDMAWKNETDRSIFVNEGVTETADALYGSGTVHFRPGE